MSGSEVLRVTGRKDRYGEVESWVCNECRFVKKEVTDWKIEGPRNIERHSVMSQNNYNVLKQLKVDVTMQKEIAEKSHQDQK